MTTTEQPRRRRHLWIVGGVAAAALLLAGGVAIGIAATRPTDPSQAEPQPTASAPAAGGVNACMAGSTPDADTLVSAQLEAPRTPEGAVSYAAAFARYLLQVPAAPDFDRAVSTTAVGVGDWATWKQGLDAWTGPRPVTATTVNGSYVVRSYTSDEAVVTLRLPWVVDGAISPSRAFAPTVTLKTAAGGNWTIAGFDGSAANDAAATTNSTPFTGGC